MKKLFHRPLVCIFSVWLIAMIGTFSWAASPIGTVRVDPYPFDATTGLQITPVLTEEIPGLTYEYRWFVNGAEIANQTSDRLPGDLLRRGDLVSVEVMPVAFGGIRLETFVSLPLEAGNSSPVITSDPPDSLGKNGYSYQVRATDPDGDTLTYRLEEGPQGMRIDARTGFVSWVFTQMPEGVFHVRISVEDGFGGRVEQSFDLKLSMVVKESNP